PRLVPVRTHPRSQVGVVERVQGLVDAVAQHQDLVRRQPDRDLRHGVVLPRETGHVTGSQAPQIVDGSVDDGVGNRADPWTTSARMWTSCAQPKFLENTYRKPLCSRQPTR